MSTSKPRAQLLPPLKRKRNIAPPEVREERREVKRERRKLFEVAHEAQQAGRPLEYMGSIHDRLVEDMRLAGCTKAQIAVAMRVSDESVVDDWMLKYPSLYEAWHRGGDLADAAVARKMFQRACGYEHPAVKIMAVGGEVVEVPYVERFAPDTSAAIFWLTNRRAGTWKQRNSTELTGADGEALVPPTINVLPVAAPPRKDEA